MLSGDFVYRDQPHAIPGETAVEHAKASMHTRAQLYIDWMEREQEKCIQRVALSFVDMSTSFPQTHEKRNAGYRTCVILVICDMH